MILDRILADKRRQIENIFDTDYIKKIRTVNKVNVKEKAFYNSLFSDNGPALIGEIKKASPSAGVLRENPDVFKIAQEYDAAEVEALSVVTEKNYFLGDTMFIREARKATGKPILRKDFIIDQLQIYESAYLGADAILLIAVILTRKQLSQFIRMSESLGMDCLVEIHDEEGLSKAVDSGAGLIGINNRDLKTMQVMPDTTRRIMENTRIGLPVVAESGITDHEAYEFVKKCGVTAVLAGEAFMRSVSIAKKAKELRYGSQSQDMRS